MKDENYTLETTGTLEETINKSHSMKELQRAIENAKMVKNEVDFIKFRSSIKIKHPDKIECTIKKPRRKEKAKGGYIWIDSIGKIRMWEKIYLILKTKGRLCNSRKETLTYELKEISERNRLINEFNYETYDYQEKCAIAMTLAIYPVIILEGYESIYLPLIKKVDKVLDECESFISSNGIQYDTLLTDVLTKKKIRITQLQHGLGYEELKNDERLEQERLISTDFIGWNKYKGLFPVLRKVKKKAKKNDIIVIYPSLNKYPGRDLVSESQNERNFYDYAVKVVLDMNMQSNRGIKIRIREDETLHRPKWVEEIKKETKWEEFELILQKYSNFICIGLSTTLVQCILSNKKILWVIHSKAAEKLCGNLSDIYISYLEKGLVITEADTINDIRKKVKLFSVNRERTIDQNVYMSFDVRRLAMIACGNIDGSKLKQ